MTAKLLKVLNERQNLYECNPPLDGDRYDCGDEVYVPNKCRYVISSRCKESFIDMTGASEVYLFKADKNGEVSDFRELPGSKKNTYDLELPLMELGYEIIKE